MLFFNGDDKERDKKRSVLGMLFNPRFDRDIKPIGESAAMFVRMIASVFAAHRLFPKDHPALNDMNVRLTLREVIGVAFGNLSFTKEGLPQVLLFVAVVGSLAFGVLFVATMFLSLFSPSTAHAASMFEPPSSKCDYAWAWIDYLFFGKGINLTSCAGSNEAAVSIPQSTEIQTALKGALAYFSSAVLVIAGIILLYHLTAMVAETAHTGKPMGRANQIWAPIRLVVAIGLLVPVGTASKESGAGGLNTGQQIVIQMAKWGSGLASNVWKTFLDGLTADMGALKFQVPPTPDVRLIVRNFIVHQACKRAYNQVLSSDPNANQAYLIKDPTVETAYDDNENELNYKQAVFVSSNGLVTCGSVRFPNKPKESGNKEMNAIANKLYGTISAQLEAALKDHYIDNASARVYRFLGQPIYDADGEMIDFHSPYKLAKSDIRSRQDAARDTQEAIKKLQTNLTNAIQTVLNDANGTTFNLKGVVDTAKDQGWVMAGSWFNTVARVQGGLYDQVNVSFSSIRSQDPKLEVSLPSVSDEDTLRERVNKVGQQLRAIYGSVKNFVLALKSRGDTVAEALINFVAELDSLSTAQKLAASGAPEDVAVTSNTANAFLGALDQYGVEKGIWDKTGVRLQFGKQANPMAEVSGFGYKLLNFGIDIMLYAGTASIFANMVGALSSVLGALGQAAGALLALAVSIGAGLVAAGVMLGFYIPLIPFIRFFFHVLTWLLTIFEAVVAAPLFALAHLSPYGDGLPGQMAQKGYFFILSIFLRPIFTIFGLIAGLLLFFISINFLNLSFGIVTAGVGITTGGMAVISKIVYSIIYAFLAYIFANNSFKSIGYFPEHAMNWIGAPASLGVNLGSKEQIGQAMTLATGYLGTKAGNALTGAASGAGTALGGAGKAALSQKKVPPEDAPGGSGGGGGGGRGNLMPPSNPPADGGGSSGNAIIPGSETANQRHLNNTSPEKQDSQNNIADMRRQMLEEREQIPKKTDGTA